MAARKAGVPLADEETIHAIRAARNTKKTKPEKIITQTRRDKAVEEAVTPTSSTRSTAVSKPGAHHDSSADPTPACSTRCRIGSGILGRAVVLPVLTVATVLTPLSNHLDDTPLASAAVKVHPDDSAT